MSTEDTKVDLFLDAHPKIDRLVTKFYLARRWARWVIPNYLEERKWKPGVYYYDHGSIPCILLRREDDSLTGQSLVDGKVIGGCSIYNCGPELCSKEDAVARADRIRDEGTDWLYRDLYPDQYPET